MSFAESQAEETQEALTMEGRRRGIVMGLRAKDGAEFALQISPQRWIVGSGTGCDLVVEDSCVSAMHCALERRPNGTLIVRDRKSRNGTFIDGNVVEAAELQVGARLVVGRTTLVAIAAADAQGPGALSAMRGRDAAFRATVEQAVKAAQTDCNVLIIGEAGTGKDLLARVIHEASRRSSEQLVAVNCGGIPRELIGSELFGHEKGAFTGAHAERDGYFVEAHGGTLFLDEIGDMPMAVQARLLRVLQEGEVRPVGGSGVRTVDVRVIAATHVELTAAVEQQRFRQDLFYRLNVVVLYVPPRRERLEDLPILAAHFLRKHGGTTPMSLSPDALDVMMNYPWPGNVRELENAIMHAVALRQGDVISPESLPNALIVRSEQRSSGAIAMPPLGGDDEQLPPLTEAKRRASAQFEKNYLTMAMERAKGSISEAARLAGLDRTNFRRLLQRHGIDATAFKS